MRTRYTAYRWKLGITSWNAWEDKERGKEIRYLTEKEQERIGEITREFMNQMADELGVKIYGEWGALEYCTPMWGTTIPTADMDES